MDLVLRTKEDMAVTSWDWRVEFSAEKRAVMILSTLQTQGTLCQEENKLKMEMKLYIHVCRRVAIHTCVFFRKGNKVHECTYY